MAIDPRTPVLIGTGQVVQRAEGIDDARDAVALMGEAITLAAQDAGLSSVPNPDAIRVVSLLSWKYGNPAQLIAEDLRLYPYPSASLRSAERVGRPLGLRTPCEEQG